MARVIKMYDGTVRLEPESPQEKSLVTYINRQQEILSLLRAKEEKKSC